MIPGIMAESSPYPAAEFHIPDIFLFNNSGPQAFQ
jgi:hypothetical protein